MPLTKSKEVFIDFTKEAPAAQLAKTTYAVATGGDNQEDFCWVGGTKYIEWIQTGQNDVTFFAPQATAPFGWLIPLDTATDGIEMTMGMAASSSCGAVSFTVGTDAAFFCRVKACITTLANTACFSVGFRELAAYGNMSTPATCGSEYDEKYGITVDDAAGAVVSHFSLAGSDTQTTATGTPIVTAQAFEFMVTVSAAGVCNGYIALNSDTTPLARPGAATPDVLLAAAAVANRTLASTTVLVPYIAAGGNATGASNMRLQEWEVGYVQT